MKCPQCEAAMTARKEAYRYTECGLPHVTLRDVEIQTCTKCGERLVGIQRMAALHKVIARAVIMKRERLTGAEIRFLRKHLGWSGVDFARYIGVDAATVSKWENDQQPMGPQADRLLRLMVANGARVDEYPNERLAEVAQDEAKPLRIELRSEKGDWREAA